MWWVLWVFFSVSFTMFAEVGLQGAVLSPDPSVGRKAPVLAHTLRIRFRPGVLPSFDPAIVSGLIAEAGRARPLLQPQQTLLYNAKLRAAANIQTSSERYQRIAAAEATLLRTFTIQYAEDEIPERMAQRLLEKYPILEVVEPYYVARPLADPPNDPYYAQQEMLQVIRAEEAWAVFPGDTSVVIGIIDSGVFQEHEDLEPSLWINRGEIPNNYQDDDGNGYVDDWRGCNFTWQEDGSDPNRTFGNGHGTAVAGIAGAAVNNGKGIAGVANRCRIFPMKTMPGGSSYIIYGYDAIIYSALMGFAVANCSWGSMAASVIEESIVNFAVARGTAIVAGAGNHGSDEPFYPAAFPAVLGVGVCRVNDGITDASAYGPHVPIFTPAQGAWTTKNDGGYGTFGATSGATPVASAAVALARARHPDLTPEQAITFVRQCVVDITDKNQRIAPYVARRLDLYQVVTRDPMATPGLRYTEHHFLTPDGVEPRQFALGDTIVLDLVMQNDLGYGDWILATLELFQNQQSLEMLQDEDTATAVETGDTVHFTFRFVLRNTQGSPIIFRFTFENDNGSYRDYHFLKFTPTTAPLRSYATFENRVVKFSMADRGAIGFASLSTSFRSGGVGFQIPPWGNILFEGGVIAVSHNLVSSAVRGVGTALDNDFRVVKGFVPPDVYTNVIADDRAPNAIGVQITQTVVLPDSSGIVALRVRVENISGTSLPELAVGYFFDWDLGAFGANNRITLRNDILRQLQLPGVLGIASRPGEYPIAVSGVVLLDGQGRPQFAGFNNDQSAEGTPFGTYDGFTDAEKRQALTSDTTLQYSGSGDVACVTGVYFDTPIPAGASREFILLFGAVAQEADLISHLQRTLAALGMSTVEMVENHFTLDVQFRGDWLFLQLPAGYKAERAAVQVWSLEGRKCYGTVVSLQQRDWIRVPIKSLPSGSYIVVFQSAERQLWRLFSVVR